MSDGTEGCAQYLPISAYAIIVDCHTLALIAFRFRREEADAVVDEIQRNGSHAIAV